MKHNECNMLPSSCVDGVHIFNELLVELWRQSGTSEYKASGTMAPKQVFQPVAAEQLTNHLI